MPAIRHRRVRVDDLDVFVREAGDPGRPTLVLLPGYPSSTRAYVRLIDRLAPDWHTVAIDYPGFGSSDPLPGTPTFDRLAEVTGRVIDRPGRAQYMQDLLWDYQTNPARYPDWQAWLRQRQPVVLAIWGQNDPFFIPAGAQAYQGDVPQAEVILLDAGHFALEEEADTIAGHAGRLLRVAFPG